MAHLRMPDGTRLHYRARGKGEPPFVFIHGWCSNLTHWDAQLRHFGKRHRVLAVDRRGHGRSDVPKGAVSAQQHAADLAEVVRSLELRSAIVVGHAGGGPTTLEFARSYPELARAVVVVDSMVGPRMRVGDPSDPAGSALGAMIDQLAGEDGAAEFERLYAGLFSPHAGPAGRKALAEARTTPREVVIGELHGLAIDTQAIAKALTQPVLWLTVAAADQAAIGTLFENVQFAQTVGSGHFPHIEVPDQTNAMIERFVATL